MVCLTHIPGGENTPKMMRLMAHHSQAEAERHDMMQMVMVSMFSSKDQSECTDVAAADT